jgi:hypothetical protein
MTSITITQLKEKLVMIDKDLASLRGEVGNERKLQVLAEYKEYIQDEIKQLENEARQT